MQVSLDILPAPCLWYPVVRSQMSGHSEEEFVAARAALNSGASALTAGWQTFRDFTWRRT